MADSGVKFLTKFSYLGNGAHYQPTTGKKVLIIPSLV